MARQPQGLRQAKEAFLSGDVQTSARLLLQVDADDGRGLILASRMALFGSNFEETEQLASRALWGLPGWSRYTKQAFYLKQEALRKSGRHREAREQFLGLPFNDPTNRFYQALRLAVDSTTAIPFYEAQCQGLPLYGARWRRATANHLLLLRNLGQVERAIELAEERHQRLKKFFRFGELKSRKVASIASKQRWIEKAGQALQDLNTSFQTNGIDLFLISGTLLGCIREGTILGHDKDIDVGVDERHSINELRLAADNCPQFKCREIYSENAIYLEHINGVFIDVFRHYRKDNGAYAHSGLKAEWENTHFGLKSHDFLGGCYSVPDDYDRYLTENYGSDWRTPKPEFETFADTPNMKVSDELNFKLYCIMATTNYYLVGDKYRISRLRLMHEQ
jgi:hypothetical protein